MNLLVKYLVATLMLCVCVGCGGERAALECSFEQVAYSPEYARGFRIEADGRGNRLLRVVRPWQGEAIVEQTLAIFRDEASARGYRGQHIVGAAERVVCMSTSHIAMLEALGEVDAVVGVSGKQYVMNERVRLNDKVKDVGYDSSLDFEAMVMLRADVVLLYGVSAENTAVTAKLRELGIPYIYLGDYTEQSPLGKAEWLVAVAEIVGCRERGEECFEAIVERYEAEREAVVVDGARPRVMLNIPYQDVWYMPSDESYMVRLVEDAGGSYIYAGRNTTEGSVGISLEEAYTLARRADVWLNVGQCRSLDELRAAAPAFADMEVVRRGAVYNNNRRQTEAGGSDFWESAIVHPDKVLRDLRHIFTGSPSELYYFKQLN